MAPLVCNYFVAEFLENDPRNQTGATFSGKDEEEKQNEYLVDRGEAMDLVRNLCSWLDKNQLTCAVLHPN